MSEPQKRRWKWLVVSLAVAVVVVAATIYLRRELAIDSCLDSGGRWDYDAGVCDMP